MEIRDLIAAQLPGYAIETVVRLGEGLENVAYEVNGSFVARVNKETDPERIGREVRLLALVATISPLPVPQPVAVSLEHGFMVYPKLPGVPLLELPLAERLAHGPGIVAQLGEMLSVLHALPIEQVADLVGLDQVPGEEWKTEAVQLYAAVEAVIPLAHRHSAEEFLRMPPPPAPAAFVFSHNDLGIEHVLVDPQTWRVTGIIDWSDAAIADPAYDFGLLYRDLATMPDACAALRERAVFYARCSVLEDLAYGLQNSKQRYIDKSLASLGWLYAS